MRREDERRIRDGREVDEDAPPASPRPRARALVFPVPPDPVSVTSRRLGTLEQRRDGSEPSSRPTSAGLGAAARARSTARRGREGRIVLEDMLLEGAELGGRLEAELVQCRARVAVGGEGVGLAAGAVEREHALRAGGARDADGGDEGVELARRARVAAGARDRASIRASRAPGRRSSRRAASARAKGSTARSASAGPRQSASALAELVRAATSRSKRSASSSPSLDADEISGRAGQDPVGAERARGARGRAPGARSGRLPGGDSPQIPSISRSVETTSLGCSRSCASNARGLGRRASPARRRRRAPPTAPTSGIPTLKTPLKPSLGGS